MAENKYRAEKRARVIERITAVCAQDEQLAKELGFMANTMQRHAGNGWVDAAEIVLDLLQGMSVAVGLPRISSAAREKVDGELPWLEDGELPHGAFDQEMTFLRNIQKYRFTLTAVTVNLVVKLRNHPPAEKVARFWVARILRLLRVTRRT